MRILQRINYYLKLGGPSILFGEIGYRIIYPFKKWFNNEFFFKLLFFLKEGYWPNLKHPRSVNEKVLYRKLKNPHPLSTIVADKWAVREYVKAKGCEAILNKVLWVGADVENIPFDKLPRKFVIKDRKSTRLNSSH